MKARQALAFLLVAGLWTAAVPAQQQQAPPQRPPLPGGSERYGLPPDLPATPVDPNSLSDEERVRYDAFLAAQLGPDATFDDVVALHLEVRAFPSAIVTKLDGGLARPHPSLPWKMEIVREEGDTIWLRGLPPENPDSALNRFWKLMQKSELLYREREHYERESFFVDFAAEVVPPATADAMHFEPLRTGLPVKGRWQMNFDLADMDGDGVDDLVFPPERLGVPHPTIFLGEKGGGFTYWTDARWTPDVPWDYGGIAAADVDGDGDQDLVLAIHFSRQVVVYQESKGMFSRAVELPAPDERVTSRAPAVADFDGDGRQDVAFLAELNYDVTRNSVIPGAVTVWIVLNLADDQWQLVKEGMPETVIGDTLSAADMDGDGRPDLVLGSNATDYRSLVWLNKPTGWHEAHHTGVLSNAWHFQALPELREGEPAQLLSTFNQFKMVGSDNKSRSGIIRYTWGDGGLVEAGTPLVISDPAANTHFRLATGDLNGDGRTDIVGGRNHGGLEVFLQSEGGEFYLERSPELDPVGRPFYIRLVDLDGDGLDDIVASFALRDPLTGGVRVWLSRRGT